MELAHTFTLIKTPNAQGRKSALKCIIPQSQSCHCVHVTHTSVSLKSHKPKWHAKSHDITNSKSLHTSIWKPLLCSILQHTMKEYERFLRALTLLATRRRVIWFTLKKAAQAPRASLSTADEKHFLQLTGTEPAVLATVPTLSHTGTTSLEILQTLSTYGGVTPCSTLSWEADRSSAFNGTKILSSMLRGFP